MPAQPEPGTTITRKRAGAVRSGRTSAASVETGIAGEPVRITGADGEVVEADVLAVGFGVTVWLTIRRWRRGQRAWWVPVVGALVTNIPVMICLMVALMNDPAMLDYATLVGS